MPSRLPYFSYNLEGQLCCHGAVVDELVEKAPLEAAYYLLLMMKKASNEELARFHTQGREMRAQVLREIPGKQAMYAPAMNVLQSLSACITVTYHDWDYLNQLLITYSAFFEEELFFYENYAQQLWKLASRRADIDADYQIFQKIISFLAFTCYGTGVADLVTSCCEAGLSLPVLIATAVGYNSGAVVAGGSDRFFPFFRDLSLMTLDKKLKKYLKNKWPIPGFVKEQPAHQEYYIKKAEALLKEALKEHKEWAPFYQVVARAAELLKSEGLELSWLAVIQIALAAIGTQESMLAVTVTFAQMPGWIGCYQDHAAEA